MTTDNEPSGVINQSLLYVKDKRIESQETSGHSVEIYAGALPPASEFERYEKACPGAGRDLFKMANKEMKHRHRCQEKQLAIEEKKVEQTSNAVNLSIKKGAAQVKVAGQGQLISLIIIAFFVAGACYCFYVNKDVGAWVFLTLVTFATLAVFTDVFERFKKTKDTKDK